MPPSHVSKDERLSDHLSSLAALAAFPSSNLPLDLAVAVAAAADAAKKRIGAILPRYCGFGIGDVVEVAAITGGENTVHVDGECLNERGTASILLQPIGACSELAAPLSCRCSTPRTGYLLAGPAALDDTPE